MQATAGAYAGLIIGIAEHESYPKSIAREGLIGAIAGAAETGIGYCVGHTIGSLMK